MVEEHLCCSLSQSLLMHYRPATGQEDFQRYVREGVDLLELQDLPFFHRPQENQIRVAVDRLYASHALYPHCILETNNQRLMLSLAQYGVGIITPIYLYICYETQSLALGLPQIVKLTNDIISTKISIVTLKDHPLPDYAEAMKVLIRDEFQRYKTVLDQLFPFSLVS